MEQVRNLLEGGGETPLKKSGMPSQGGRVKGGAAALLHLRSSAIGRLIAVTKALAGLCLFRAHAFACMCSSVRWCAVRARLLAHGVART
jgi:hypothetical protein